MFEVLAPGDNRSTTAQPVRGSIHRATTARPIETVRSLR